MLIGEAEFMSKKKTHEEYVTQVAEINPNIEILNRYDVKIFKRKD